MAQKKNIWNVNVDNIVISKLVETKTIPKCLIEYLDQVIIPLILPLSKMNGNVKTFKVKDWDKDKNNKLMSFRIDDEKLLEKYKTIWTKIEDIKNIELNALTIYDDGGGKVYTNFCGLSVPEDDAVCESFTVISIDSLLV